MTTSEIMIGPEIGQNRLTADLDFYKPTMSQLAFEKHPDAQVTFSLINRNHDQPLSVYVSAQELQQRLDSLRSGWTEKDIESISGIKRSDGQPLFSKDFLGYLAVSKLPEIKVDYDSSGEITAQPTGDMPLVSFWETVVMAEENEIYFNNKVRSEGLDVTELYEEGDKRLDKKIETLKSRPDIKIIDFGTRRRFSFRWHQHVIERLVNECPQNIIGTSNVYFAHKYGLPAVGTFAHELPMVYAGLADQTGRNPLEGHEEMLEDWQELYGPDLSIALSDTFGSDFFLANFSSEQAKAWKGLRHDSGDPIEFANKVIDFYESNNIDPATKTLVFSDGLDIDQIVRLADKFNGRIKLLFGWGTSLTNDLGLKPNNIVMKATAVNGTPTVKLSDSPTKHTGPEYKVKQYAQAVARKLVESALENNKQLITL